MSHLAPALGLLLFLMNNHFSKDKEKPAVKHIFTKTTILFRGVLALSAIAFLNSSAAFAASPSIAIVAAPALSSVRTSDPLPQEQGFSKDRKLGWGGGVLLDAPLADMLSLGLGALYVERKFEIGTGTVRFERKVPTLFVPLEMKVWLGNIFAIGAGGFGAFKMGDPTDTAVLGSGTIEATTNPGRDSFNYGLTASAHALLPLANRTGILIGGRYLYGLNDPTNSPLYEEKVDDIVFEGGLSFSF